jgi:hypothetical protein
MVLNKLTYAEYQTLYRYWVSAEEYAGTSSAFSGVSMSLQSLGASMILGSSEVSTFFESAHNDLLNNADEVIVPNEVVMVPSTQI